MPGGQGEERWRVGGAGMPSSCHLALPPPAPDDGQEEAAFLKISEEGKLRPRKGQGPRPVGFQPLGDGYVSAHLKRVPVSLPFAEETAKA